MRRALTMLVVVSISCASAVLLSAAAGQSLPNDRYSRREADNIGARLFKAIVGRDGGATGPSDAATQIMLGHLDAQVEAMFNSSEFRQKAGGMNPTQILDQIYSGLLDRKADDAGIRTYLREIEQRKYAVVVLKIINDTEFETRILGRPTRQNRPNSSNRPDSRPDNRSDFGSSRPYGNRTVSMRSVEACQMEVLEQVRTDVAGTVLLNFQDPDMSSAGWGIETIRGSATDVLDRNHRLSYRCEMERNRSTPARVSYSFDEAGGVRHRDSAWTSRCPPRSRARTRSACRLAASAVVRSLSSNRRASRRGRAAWSWCSAWSASGPVAACRSSTDAKCRGVAWRARTSSRSDDTFSARSPLT
ncbi:MAG: DUF4214 domain-containing protein [Acidobacteriota bacterium]